MALTKKIKQRQHESVAASETSLPRRIASLFPVPETGSGFLGHPLTFAGILLITGVSF